MEVIKNLVTPDKYAIKCPFNMEAAFFVVHNTANDAPAKNEIAYMVRNNNQVSFHYAIDDEEIIQGIPEDRNAWHAGDGRNGNGNRAGIAIEICYSKSGGEKFIKAEKRAAQFIAFELKEKGWGIERVKKHQDFSKKYCPHRTLDMGWERFLNMIKAEMNTKTAETGTETVKKAIYYPKYTDVLNSLVDALKSLKIDASYANRQKIAEVNGITNYAGKAEQNTKMLALLKQGLLVKEYTEETIKISENKAPETAQKVEYYPKYNGTSNSLVDALKSLKIDSSLAHRKQIAEANHIGGYTGKAKENERLLLYLKHGKLIKA